MIEVQSFTFNPFAENTYVLFDETKEAIIIDPGCYENHEKEKLVNFIKEKELKVSKLINTHGHIDHVLGNQFIKEQFDLELSIYTGDLETLRSVSAYASNYGFQHYQPAEPDHFLNEGDIIEFGNSKLEVLFVPGHAPGHIALVSHTDKICIGGDVLFHGSIGRTDLPGGDFDTLIKSIHEKMFPLGDDMLVYCGHGPTTTIGEEKKSNPFCALPA